MSWDAHPYDATGYLYVLRPAVVFAARVNAPGGVSYPLASIPYDGITTGTLADVKQGMTVLVGSVPGGYDRGRIYVRATGWAAGDVGTATNLYVGYCSRGRSAGEVDLADDSYITVLDLYEVWKRASRMNENGTVFKDYDWVVSVSPPIARLSAGSTGGGLAYMDFVDPETGVLALDLDAGDSRVTAEGAALVGRVWDIAGGSIVSGTVGSEQISAIFPRGAHWIGLTNVVDDHVAVALPRRQLLVALDDDDRALLKRVSRATWQRAPEGGSMSFELRERLAPADCVPGTVVIWLVRERYDGVEGSQTGWHIKFAGYLDYARSFGQAGTYDFERASTLYALDVAGRLRQLRGMPSEMRRVTALGSHNEMIDADIERYLWWMLYWHSTAPILADYVPGDTDYPFSVFHSPGGNPYAAGDNLAKGVAHRLTMDSRGRLLVKPDPLRLDPADRTETVQRALQPADIVRIERLARSRPRTGVMRASFLLTSETNAADLADEAPAVYGIAPGVVEGSGEGESWMDYPQLAASAAEGYARLGHDYARENSLEDVLHITLAHGGDGGLEPALMEWVTVTTDDDTVGWTDEPLDAARCLVVGVNFTYDDEAATITQSIDVIRETTGTPAAEDPNPPLSTLTPTTPVTTPSLTPIAYVPARIAAGTSRIALICTNKLILTSDFQTLAASGGPTYADGGDWTSLGADGTVLLWVPNGYDPGTGWLFTTTKIYSLTLATGALTLLHSWSQAVQSISADASFSERGFCVAVAYVQDVGAIAAYALDGRNFTEVAISPAYATNGALYGIFTGCFVSSRIPGKVIATAYTSTAAVGSAATAAYASLNHGKDWAQIASPVIIPGVILAQHIHAPWENNADESIVYYTSNTGISNSDHRLLRSGSDVTPDIGGTRYQPRGARDGIATSFQNRQRLLTVGQQKSFNYAVFLSSDAGGSYAVLDGDGSDFRHAAISGDDEDVGWTWGANSAISQWDLDAQTADSKTGNLASLSAGDIIAIAGY